MQLRPVRPGARVWLLAVILAIMLVVGVDAWTAITTARGTETLSANALRSIELAQDMRWQLSRLSPARDDHGGEDARAQTVEWLRRDLRAYEPLATFEGERSEWTTLSRMVEARASDLGRVDAERATREVEAARESVERIIALNRAEADRIEHQLAGLGRKQLMVDGLAGAVVILALEQLARSRLRALERERAATAAALHAVEDKNRELEAFAGRVAHDLRGPLTPVKALAGALARGAQPGADVQRIGARIAGAASRMSDVIEAMLTFSRSGRVPPGTSELRAVVQDALDDLEAEQGGVELRVEVPEARVASAPEVLEQVLRNVLGNAIKYRAEDRPCRVELVGRLEEETVLLSIGDNGLGMDREAVRRCFEPFFRGRSDRAGHGLGLAIVERYVRALGGTIRLTSEPNVGTRVDLRLPRAREVAAPEPVATARQPAGALARGTAGSVARQG